MSEGIPSVDQIQAQQQQQAELEERRQIILDQILEPEAKERLSRLSIVKKEKARAVGDTLIRAATGGQLKAKVSDQELIKMLEQISGPGESETAGKSKRGVTIQRRKTGFEDDDDDDDDI